MGGGHGGRPGSTTSGLQHLKGKLATDIGDSEVPSCLVRDSRLEDIRRGNKVAMVSR